MAADLTDLTAFVAVVRSSGFREASRATGASASSLSEAVRRLETRLGVRLLNRSTRSVAPTEAGARLFERLALALTEVEASLDVVNNFRDRPAGTLRLNVPVSAARLVLPRIVPAFLAAYPDICLDVIAEDSFVDMLAAGCDAGIRYDERLERDMVAIPIGPREDWLRPHLDSGALEAVLESWWQRFSGPFLYYPSRRQLPAPLRAFIDFTRSLPA